MVGEMSDVYLSYWHPIIDNRHFSDENAPRLYLMRRNNDTFYWQRNQITKTKSFIHLLVYHPLLKQPARRKVRYYKKVVRR